MQNFKIEIVKIKLKKGCKVKEHAQAFKHMYTRHTHSHTHAHTHARTRAYSHTLKKTAKSDLRNKCLTFLCVTVRLAVIQFKGGNRTF